MRIVIENMMALYAPAYDFVMQGFETGMREGDFPAYRSVPSREDIVSIVYDEDTPMGFAVYYPYEDYGRVWLDLLWVAPKHRRKSVGTRLLASVLAYGERHGMAVEFGTLIGNEGMRSLAASFGLYPNIVSYRKEPVAA